MPDSSVSRIQINNKFENVSSIHNNLLQDTDKTRGTQLNSLFNPIIIRELP